MVDQMSVPVRIEDTGDSPEDDEGHYEGQVVVGHDQSPEEGHDERQEYPEEEYHDEGHYEDQAHAESHDTGRATTQPIFSCLLFVNKMT